MSCKFYFDYCNDFIHLNVDGILTLCQNSEMDQYLNDMLADGAHNWEMHSCDEHYHPLIFDIVGNMRSRTTIGAAGENEESSFNSWVKSCAHLMKQLPLSLLVKHCHDVNGLSSFLQCHLGMLSCSRSALFNDETDLTSMEFIETTDKSVLQSKCDKLSKELCGVKK